MIEPTGARVTEDEGWIGRGCGGVVIGARNGEWESTKIRRVKLITDLITGFPLIKSDKWSRWEEMAVRVIVRRCEID